MRWAHLQAGVRRHPWPVALATLLVAMVGIVHTRVHGRVDAAWWVETADAALERGEFESARHGFERAVSLDPGDHDALNGLARALEAMGDLPASVAVQQRIVDRARRLEWPRAERRTAWRNLAFSAWRLGDLQQAQRALQVLHDHGMATLRTDLMLAVAAVRLHEPQAAARTLQAMRQRYGEVEAVWRLAAVVESPGSRSADPVTLEAFLGMRPAASRSSRGSPPRGAAHPFDALVDAETALASGDLALAEATLRAVTDTVLAGNRELLRARLALARDVPRAALAALDRAATAPLPPPTEAQAFFRGLALSLAGRLDGAMAAARRAVAANRLSRRARWLLARTALARGDAPSARDALEGVLRLEPADAAAMLELGQLLADQEPGQAAAWLERYLAVAPRGPERERASRLWARLRGRSR